MTGLALYGRYLAVSFRGNMQYRATVVLQSLGAFLVTIVEFIGIWALFDRFGQLRGWRLPEVALFYGIVSIAWSVCDTLGRGFDVFHTLVKAGEFDRLLVRPRSTVLQLLGHELRLRRMGRLIQGALVLGYAISALDIDWSAARVLLLVVSILGTVCVFLGLLVMQATMAFWTTDAVEVWNAFTYGGVTMSQYPMPIYRTWFRELFTYVIPLAAVCYLPGVAILGIPDPLGTPVVAQWLAPLAGPVFLAIALGVWRIGVRHHRSTGS